MAAIRVSDEMAPFSKISTGTQTQKKKKKNGCVNTDRKCLNIMNSTFSVIFKWYLHLGNLKYSNNNEMTSIDIFKFCVFSHLVFSPMVKLIDLTPFAYLPTDIPRTLILFY